MRAFCFYDVNRGTLSAAPADPFAVVRLRHAEMVRVAHDGASSPPYAVLMFQVMDVLILAMAVTGAVVGAVLQIWPRVLLGVVALTCLVFVVLATFALWDAAGCWDCRSGDMSDGGYAVFYLLIRAVWFSMTLALLAFGAGVGWLVRRALR